MSLLEVRGLWVRPPGVLRSGRPIRPGTNGTPSIERDGFAVRDASLSLEPGEWLGITGPNGGGKTSLLMALSGLWPAARGEVRVGGDRLEPGSPRNVRSRVAVILQDPSSQLLQSTVRDEIAFASRNLDVPAEVVDRECDRWITRFGLGDLLDLDPASLSAGRQQLVLIAGALAARPSLLIADEPGAHLDQESRLLVLEALAQERGKGLALVWASQDPGELAAADRTLAMGEEGAHIAPEEEPTPMPALAAPGLDEALLELRVAPRTGVSGPRVETVEGFVLRIGTHRIEAITGPNGTGKSVLLASAAGLEVIPQVAVSWKQDRPWPPILVAQYPERLFFEEVVRDEVAFAACSRGVDRSQALGEAQRCFDRLNLESDLMTRRLWELSGGMRRLVEVVAALIAPACLVALDEPTAGLDRERREGLAELVRERAGSSAVLIASQDLRWLGRVGARLTPIGHATVSKTPSISKKTD